MRLFTHTARSGFTSPSSPRERAVSAVLSALVLFLFGLALLRLGNLVSPPPRFGSNLTAINVSPASAAKHEQNKAKEVQKAAQPAKTVAVPVPAVMAQKIVIPVTKAPPVFIQISNDDFAKSDISKLAKASGGSSAGDSKGTYGPGAGPQGQQLYNAEWVREPTHAELAGYMTQRSQGGDWADIACRTIDHYHVDNCQPLGESPAGSGLARSLRQAAWQFLVRPPRVGGKMQVGAWVRIHFKFTRSARSEKDDSGSEPAPSDQ